MKKLIATFADMTNVDLTSVLTHAVEFKLETVPNGEPARTKNRVPGMTAQLAIMEHFTPEGVFLRLTARKWLKAKGYKESGLAPALSKLAAAGKIRRLGGDKCQFVKE